MVLGSLVPCLGCGARIVGPLARLGSMRCADCRSESRPLDAALVALHVRGPRSSRDRADSRAPEGSAEPPVSLGG